MNTGGSGAIVLVLVAALALAVPSSQPRAQGGGVPAPALTTEPSPPPAGQPFQATFSRWSSTPTVGFGGQAPTIVVDRPVVRVHFDPGCGFLCPPATVYRSWTFTMPALSAGSYTVSFGYTGATIAQFQLAVGAGAPTPSPVPGPGLWSLALLVVLVTAVAALRLRRQRLQPSRPHR